MSSLRVSCFSITWTTALVTNFVLRMRDFEANPSGRAAVKSIRSTHESLSLFLVLLEEKKGCIIISNPTTVYITSKLLESTIKIQGTLELTCLYCFLIFPPQ